MEPKLAKPPRWLDRAISAQTTQTMLDQLREWHAVYSTCIVPRNAHDAVELADWVRLVRKANRGGWVPAELRAALDELGFEWDVPLLDAQWHSCFHAARASKVAQEAAESGTAPGGDEGLFWEGAATWLARQQTLYRQQKLTLRRLHLLKSVLGEKYARQAGPLRRNRHAMLKADDAVYKAHRSEV